MLLASFQLFSFPRLSLFSPYYLWKNKGIAWCSCSSRFNSCLSRWKLGDKSVNHTYMICNQNYVTEISLNIIEVSKYFGQKIMISFPAKIEILILVFNLCLLWIEFTSIDGCIKEVNFHFPNVLANQWKKSRWALHVADHKKVMQHFTQAKARTMSTNAINANYTYLTRCYRHNR